jgi:hypothetical protein
MPIARSKPPVRLFRRIFRCSSVRMLRRCALIASRIVETFGSESVNVRTPTGS